MTAKEAIQRPEALKHTIPIPEKIKSGSEEPRNGASRIPLSRDLEDALREVREQLHIDTNMINSITQHFEDELIQGLEKPSQNIVC